MLTGRIPLKIHAYNHETVLLGCNVATNSDVTFRGYKHEFSVGYVLDKI